MPESSTMPEQKRSGRQDAALSRTVEQLRKIRKAGVTVTFEGNSQTMIFYDGGTNDAVTGPGGGVKAPKKWPDNFVNDTSSTYNNWHGASRETGITVVPWNTSEFGYTANVPCHLSKVGDLVVKKMDAETKEAISGAEFTVYRWKNNTWSEFKKMNWVKKTGSYLLEGIHGYRQ